MIGLTSLRCRTLIFLFTLFCLILGATAFVFVPRKIETSVAQAMATVEPVIEVTVEGLVPMLVGGELANVYDQLDLIKERLPIIQEIVLTDDLGRSLYPLFEPAEMPSGKRIEIQTYQIGGKNARLGTIQLVLDLNVIADPIIQEATNQLLLIFGVMLFVTFLTYFLAERVLLTPIQRLTSMMDATALGIDDSEVARPKMHSYELETLADSFERARWELRASAEQLKTARDEAEKANKAKTDFLANMSHELRTPLSGVLGITEVLVSENHDPRTKELLNSVHGAGERLLHHLNQILDLTRIETGEMRYFGESFSVSGLVHEITGLFKQTAKAKGIYLKHDSTVDVETVTTDKEKLAQVLTNLVNNAIKFTETGGVTISTALESRDGRTGLIVSVTDTGIGISDDHLETIFEKFNQGDSSTTRRYGGSGLGLTICQSLVTFLDGEISAKSGAQGGTTMSVWLPVKLQAKPTKTRKDRAAPTQLEEAFKQLKILVVDDEPINRLHAEKLLEKHGLTDVTLVEDGHQAVRRATADKYDVILMDCHMPNLDGLEATELIRKQEQTLRNTPAYIIGFTANIMPGVKENCLEVGMDDMMTKPLSIKKLHAALTRFSDHQNVKAS